MAGRTYEEAKALYEAGQRNVSFDAGPVYGPRTYDATLIPDSYDYKVFNPAAQVNYGANLTQAQQIFKQATGLDLTGDGLNVVTGHIRQGDSPEQALKNLGDLGNYVKFSTDYNGGTSGGPAGPAGPDYSKTPGFWEASAGVTTPQATLQAVPNPLQGYQGGNATTSSIVDYLGSLGKATDFNSRKALAEQAGIANYTGTASQNTQLLGMLRGSTPASSVITPSSLESAKGVTLPGVQIGTLNQADAMVMGANTSIQQLLQSLFPQETETDKKQQSILDEMTKLIGEQGNVATDQLNAENAAGLPQLKQQLAELDGQIKTKVAEYEMLLTQNKNRPVTMSSVIGSERAILDARASDIGLLSARAEALAGRISVAQETIDRSISLKYQAQEAKLNLYQAQLNALKPTLDKEERQRALVQELMIDQYKSSIADAKAQDKQIQSLMLNAASSGASNELLSRISNSKTLEEASQVYAEFTRQQLALVPVGRSGGRGGGGGSVDFGTPIDPSAPTQLLDKNGKPIKLTATQVEAVVGFQTALSQIQEARNLIETENPNTGPISGRLSEITRLADKADPNLVRLDALLSSIKANFMKAISGAAVSEAEVQRLSKFLPNINDTEGNLAIKLNQFESSLSQQKNTYFATLGAANQQQTTQPTQKTEDIQTSTLPKPVQQSFWSKVGNFLFGD